MKKRLFFIPIFFLLFTSLGFFYPGIIFSAGTTPRSLEVTYPVLPGIPTITLDTGLPTYAKYIYFFFIIFSGVIALGVIVYAGFQYLTSGGMPEKIKDAKNRIGSALLGLLILFFSWLILNTINPQLVSLPQPGELPLIPPDLAPGVYLCKDRVDIKGFWTNRKAFDSQSRSQQKDTFEKLYEALNTVNANCYKADTGGGVLKDYEDKITFVYLVPLRQKTQYGAVLYEESNFGGKGEVVYGDGAGSGGVKDLENPSEWQMPSGFLVSSARPFILNFEPKPTWFVQLFKDTNFNYNDPSGEFENFPASGLTGGAESFSSPLPEIGSVMIEGELIVVFFKDSSGGWTVGETEIDVATSSLTNLNNSLMGRWLLDQCVERREPTWRDRTFPCAPGGFVIVVAHFL